jgi:hypothetical protein
MFSNRQVSVLALILAGVSSAAGAVSVVTDASATPRELYGAEKVRTAIASLEHPPAEARVLAAVRSAPLLSPYTELPPFAAAETEAYVLRRSGNVWLVVGSDPSGVLYGCLELARRIGETGGPPATLDVRSHPEFKIRGTCLLWTKWGPLGYNYPITPANFPWFFDRARMLHYLDLLAENRYNTIFFWNGHPFPYFLKLPKYPEARMLDDADLQRNIDQFTWFTREADRRGIWTVLHFYNIHVSPNFAKAHEHEGVKVENAAATPLLVDYTRYCVGEFVRTYPNVGLMVTAGEALRVNREEFVRDAIVAGIEDTGLHPPLIVRQWQIDPDRFHDIVRPTYDNLFTMMKHNTEMLVSPYADPRNKTWVSFGLNHIVNVHENADVKPLRWGSPLFIHQMMDLWKQMGVAGFHLYPMMSWQWPDNLDRVSPPLDTVDRDWIWIEAFGRYGWQLDRPAAEEERYWKERLRERFGSSEAADAVYRYYVETGPVSPTLQNIVNIYNMNFHPTLVSQESTLNGILHSDRWEGIGNPLAQPLDEVTLQNYEAKYGKLDATARLQPPSSIKELVRAESMGAPLKPAPDPLRVVTVLEEMAAQALEGLERTQNSAARNQAEFQRFRNDAGILARFSRFYRAKLEAALEKGRYDALHDVRHLDRALDLLGRSVEEYRAMTKLADAGYRQATDLLPVYQWTTVQKQFEDELAFYRAQRALYDAGAEVAILGTDGPVNDASNAFHWLLEETCAARGWKVQSYAFGPNPLGKARLAVVYDMTSPEYTRDAPQLAAWVRRGGMLLIWDPLARANPSSPLLAGLEFSSDSAYRSAFNFEFDGSNLLTRSLSGIHSMFSPADQLHSSIRAAGPEWQELAYTVISNVSGHQFYTGDPTFGPRWTSLMDTVKAPVLLSREIGAGHIVIAQLGTTSALVRPDVRAVLKGSPLSQLVENLVNWAAGQGQP